MFCFLPRCSETLGTGEPRRGLTKQATDGVNKTTMPPICDVTSRIVATVPPPDIVTVSALLSPGVA